MSQAPSNQQFPELMILTYTCPLKWDDLKGTHAIRHCDQCSLNVLNISHSFETEVDEVFTRARQGATVCIRSEGLGPRKPGFNRSFKRGMTAAMSLVSAWFIGFLKSPAIAQDTSSTDKKKTEKRNVFRLEDEPSGGYGYGPPPSNIVATGSTSPLAQLSSVDRFGFGVMMTPTFHPQQSSDIWNQIYQLKFATNCRGKRTDPIKKLREQIIKRAENDKVVSTDEVIELSNKYRSAGLDAAADQTLGLAITLLDIRKSNAFRRTPMSARVGESPDRTISQTFGYSMRKLTDLYNYNRLLQMSDQQMLAAEYATAAVCLKEALVFSLSNPLLSDAVRKTDFAKRIQQLESHIPKTELNQLQNIHEMVKTRLDDLSKLKT